MERRRVRHKRVAIVATGDELVNGDILNTNGQYFTQCFIEQGIEPGRQVIVADDDDEIKHAIDYLAQDHQAIITIGGLGPTSDDKTRFGLAKALGLELAFYDQAWQWIVARLQGLKLQIPATNRQQALFPIGSELIENPNGTAAACYIQHNTREYFMLPGPPNECRVIFDQQVLPKLMALDYAQPTVRRSWLLLDVSESDIAAKLDPLAADSPCNIGYRVSYPYLEVKLISANLEALETLSSAILAVIRQHVVSDSRQYASKQLRDFLNNYALKFSIEDQATFGLLQSMLSTPSNIKNLFFNERAIKSLSDTDIKISIEGLEHYWQPINPHPHHMPLCISISTQSEKKTINTKVPYRGTRSLAFAVEMICWRLILFLQKKCNH